MSYNDADEKMTALILICLICLVFFGILDILGINLQDFLPLSK